ncbi:DUF7573 domain-containing protein [Haloarcula salina]|uniref:DUF7573 domain-containing protein n=1 Tax=Haloarcula salina TaxID=1429914 RepID=UPI003C6EC7A6
MGEDASLDDFLDAGEESEGGESAAGDDGDEAEADAASEPEAGPDESDGEGDASASESTDRGTVEPAVTTYAWSPEGAACADCGEVVERRWEQDGQLVCGACKSW